MFCLTFEGDKKKTHWKIAWLLILAKKLNNILFLLNSLLFDLVYVVIL